MKNFPTNLKLNCVDESLDASNNQLPKQMLGMCVIQIN